MRRIFKDDNLRLLLTPGTKLLRIVRHFSVARRTTTIKSEMTVTRGPYRRLVETFQRECDFIKVIERYPSGELKEYEYFISDLFNGEVYILDGDDIIKENKEFIRNTILDSKEYITDKDLEISI